jgi:hypothetical protein
MSLERNRHKLNPDDASQLFYLAFDIQTGRFGLKPPRPCP